MRSAESPPTTVRRRAFSQWLHAAIAIALLFAAVVFDIVKPFDKSWSIFYLVPTLYAGWTLRAGLEWLILTAITLTVFLAPLTLRPALLTSGTGVFNRSLGILLGLLVVLLLRDRRHQAEALQRANDDLEDRVRERTAELQAANDGLRREQSEREQAEADRTRLEEQLRHAHKLEAVGRLAGGVAHDFNNLLTVINGESGTLLESVQADSPLHSSIAAIHEAGERATEVTRQLLAFGRKQVLQTRVLDVNQAIEGVEQLLRRLLPENIRLTLDLDRSVPPIVADPSQFSQVLLNLASNARDAMPGGGEFRIKTESLIITGHGVAPDSDLDPGPYIRLSVSDNGRGMDAATWQHAFEPFFTTKEIGKGTGLGLASVYGIVRQSRGHIDVASSVSGGTTFSIVWPCTTEKLEPQENTLYETAEGALDDERILLVEDEEQVRTFTTTLLRRKGYQVVEAVNGLQALAAVTAHDAPSFALLITDVVMPEMSGPELVQRLAAIRPGLRVLYVSGYPRAEVLPGLGDSAVLLAKPFSPRELVSAIRRVLRQP